MSVSVIPWTVSNQAPTSMGFSRQEYWSELPFPSPGGLPDPGIEPRSPHCRQTRYNLSHQRIPPLLLLLLLLLLLSRFSRVRLCMTPQTAAHQAPPSLGFSRQEHWSGLPFPPPMHESEVKVKSLSRVQLLVTHGLQPTRLLHSWDFPDKSTGVRCHCLLRRIPL